MGLKQLLGDLVGVRPQRLQVAALCLRGAPGAREVLMVTSRGSGRWILPKGWPVAGLDLPGSALQEAWEEAGVSGTVDPQPVGHYEDFKRIEGDFGHPVRVQVYRVDDVRLDDAFPEAGQRQRRWASLDDAVELVNDGGLAGLLRTL